MASTRLVLVALLVACLSESFVRLAPRGRRRRCALRGRQLSEEDFRELLERPEGAKDLQEILKEMLQDKKTLKESNATFQELMAAQSGAENADPLAQFLTDPAAVFQWTQGPDKTQRLAEMMQQSPLFQQLRNFGSEVLERRQVAQLPAGALVELRGLSAAAYNGLVGELADASPAEQDQHPGRRIVELREGVEDSTRLAVHPKNLIFPRHKPGDAVTLAAEFEPGSEHEGLEGRAGVISSLTEEERGLGFSEQTGGLVVDVLSLLPGGPVLDRVWLWPEHLARRNFQLGDGVRMRDLEADSSLNGLPATVEAPGTRPWSYVVVLDDGRRLEVKWRNLLLSSCSVATAAGLG